MKRRLSMISATAILLSAAMLCSCDVQDIVVNGSAGSPTGETAVGTIGVPGTSVAIGIPDWDWIHPLPPVSVDSPSFPRAYEEIADFEAYKKNHVNLTELYYDIMVNKLSIYRGFDYTIPDEYYWDCGMHEFPSNLFDGVPETKWCSGSADVTGVSAVVWCLCQPVYVTAYSFTTTPDAVNYPDRDPISWRLYAANELPNDSMDDTDPETGLTYFESAPSVPNGWVLIDSVNAKDPNSMSKPASLIPDKERYEAGLELPCPGYYRYFMLLIDECEGDTFEMGDFTLYGYDSIDSTCPTVPCTEDTLPYHPYKEIEDLDQFKHSHVNLAEAYFDKMSSELSIFTSFDYRVDGTVEIPYYDESPRTLFDGDVTTKWCCSSNQVQFASAVVWSMTEAVNVDGYSITTANDNLFYTDRNPISWRLYGANELPPERMDDFEPYTDFTYLEKETVPDGWVLIDAVDAARPDDIYQSQIPDENFLEVGMMAENPGCYKYFMLLIDYCEGGTFQMSEFTLYGTVG